MCRAEGTHARGGSLSRLLMYTNIKMRRMMEIDPDANMLTHRFPIIFTPLQHRKLLACTQQCHELRPCPNKVSARHSKKNFA